MPFHMSIPLPGPFRYSTRIGGHKRRRNTSRFSSPLYWLFGVWAFEGAFWVAVGFIALISVGVQYLYRLTQRPADDKGTGTQS